MVKLSAQQRNTIMCTAQRLRLHSQDIFFRATSRILSTCPQPVSMNDVLRACDLALEIIPSSDVLISRSMGPTNDDEYYNDCAQVLNMTTNDDRMITPMHERALDRLRQFKAACEPRPPTTVVVNIDGALAGAPAGATAVNGVWVADSTPRGTVTS